MVSVSQLRKRMQQQPGSKCPDGLSGPPDTPIPLFCKIVFILSVMLWVVFVIGLIVIIPYVWDFIREILWPGGLSRQGWIEVLVGGWLAGTLIIVVLGAVGFPALLARRIWGAGLIRFLLLTLVFNSVLMMFLEVMSSSPDYAGLGIAVGVHLTAVALIGVALRRYRAWYLTPISPDPELLATFD